MNYLEFLANVDDSHPMTTAVMHIEVLCRYAKRATSILELGSHAGISAAAMALANPHATIVSVDLCDTVIMAVKPWVRVVDIFTACLLP